MQGLTYLGFNWALESKWVPTFLSKSLLKVKMLNTYENAPLASELNGKKIVPIVFSHGLTFTPNFYSLTM